ncbi:MAG: hypothetical protein ACRCSK_06915 [Fusobacteriaceae bacterium]
MRKRILLFGSMLIISAKVFALGGVEILTTPTISGLGNPVQQAIVSPESGYYNPAALGFIKKGAFFSFGLGLGIPSNVDLLIDTAKNPPKTTPQMIKLSNELRSSVVQVLPTLSFGYSWGSTAFVLGTGTTGQATASIFNTSKIDMNKLLESSVFMTETATAPVGIFFGIAQKFGDKVSVSIGGRYTKFYQIFYAQQGTMTKGIENYLTDFLSEYGCNVPDGYDFKSGAPLTGCDMSGIKIPAGGLKLPSGVEILADGSGIRIPDPSKLPSDIKLPEGITLPADGILTFPGGIRLPSNVLDYINSPTSGFATDVPSSNPKAEDVILNGGAIITSDGFAPEIGVYYKPIPGLDISAKYLWSTKLERTVEIKEGKKSDLENSNVSEYFVTARKDYPAVLSTGAAYDLTERDKFLVGFNYIFESQATTDPIYGKYGDTQEIMIGYERNFNKKFYIDLGYTHVEKSGNNKYPVTVFELDSNSYGLGLSYRTDKDAKITLAGSFVDYISKTSTDEVFKDYNAKRREVLVGLSITKKFN